MLRNKLHLSSSRTATIKTRRKTLPSLNPLRRKQRLLRKLPRVRILLLLLKHFSLSVQTTTRRSAKRKQANASLPILALQSKKSSRLSRRLKRSAYASSFALHMCAMLIGEVDRKRTALTHCLSRKTAYLLSLPSMLVSHLSLLHSCLFLSTALYTLRPICFLPQAFSILCRARVTPRYLQTALSPCFRACFSFASFPCSSLAFEREGLGCGRLL